jgi:hypothetical protein
VCQDASVPIDPSRFEQFFRRSSSGDWVYVGYGPDIFGKVVSSADREWLLENLPKLSAMKRWTVGLFSAPLVWLLAIFLNTAVLLIGTPYARWVFRRREELAMLALVLLVAFLVGTFLIAIHPIAREFARVIAKKPKEDSIGLEKFFMNLGAVNGRFVTSFLMLGFGALVVPCCFNPDVWYFFAPLALAWAYMAWYAFAGAFWKPPLDEY